MYEKYTQANYIELALLKLEANPTAHTRWLAYETYQEKEEAILRAAAQLEHNEELRQQLATQQELEEKQRQLAINVIAMMEGRL